MDGGAIVVMKIAEITQLQSEKHPRNKD